MDFSFNTLYLAENASGNFIPPNGVTGLRAWLKPDTMVTSSLSAASFVSANSESLTVASNATLQVGNIDFSGCFWVNIIDTTQNYEIFSKWAGASGREFRMSWIGSVGAWYWAVSSDGSDAIEAVKTQAISNNTWYFVAFYHNATTDEIGVSVNGSAFTTQAHAGGVITASQQLQLGAGASTFLGGRLTLAGWWKNRAISLGDVTELYAAGAGLSYAALSTAMKVNMVSYWNLGEASGTRSDSHGTNHLTDNNTVGVGLGVAGGTGSGSIVTSWTDASGNGYTFAQATDGQAPTYVTNGIGTLPTARFDGNDYMTQASALGLANGSARSFFAVCKLTDAAARSPIVHIGDTADPACNFGFDANTGNTAGNLFGFYATSGMTYDSAKATDTNWHILYVSASTTTAGQTILTSLTYQVDGVTKTLTQKAGSGTTYGTMAAANQTALGKYPGDAATFALMELAEISVYDTALDAHTRDGVKNWLAREYGL